MMTRNSTKLVHEGDYAAEIEVVLIEDETGWSPYLSPQDAAKIDKVRRALRAGEIKTASTLAKVYRLEPVAA
jgi:hypothetical protein